MTKPGKLYTFLSSVFKVFMKKPQIVNLNETLVEQAIFVSNHSAASGPFTLSIYFPILFRPWGVYHMCFGYRKRWIYLYNTFYQQKLNYGKVKAFFLATLMGLVTGIAYQAMNVIPSYEDGRLIRTLKDSIAHLEKRQAVLVFPEDSSRGYYDVLTHYHPGFVFLSEQFYKKNKIDLPVYSVYYNKKDNAFIIDKPQFLTKLFSEEKTRAEIAIMFRDRANELSLILKERIKLLRSKKKGKE